MHNHCIIHSNGLEQTIFSDGSGEEWRRKDNVYHREDGPAWTGSRGQERWYLNGVLHCPSGPALRYPFDPPPFDYAWYLQGRHIKTQEEYQFETGLTDEDMSVLILKYGHIG